MIAQYFNSYIVTLLVLVGLDVSWICLFAKDIYKKQIGHLMGNKNPYWPALILYALYAAALLVFVIEPSLDDAACADAIKKALLLGLTCYGAYSLTNQATLNKWPLNMTIMVMAWGATLTSLVTCISRFILIKG